jgi:replicative DNA helicase
MTNIQELTAIESEKEILSMMMQHPGDVIPIVRAEIVVDDFARQTHRLLYTNLVGMYQAKKPIEIDTLAPYMQSNGDLVKLGDSPIIFISAIYNKAVGKTTLEYHLGVVKDRARRIKAIGLMDAAIAQAMDLSSDFDTHSFLADLAKVTADRHLEERTIQDIAMAFLEDIGNRANQNPDDVCVMSGLKKLDAKLHGFRKQELTYLAARPAMGKSALATQIALHVALNQGKQVMYASLEMGDKQLMGRAVANLTEINSEKIMFDYDFVNSADYGAVLREATRISQSGLHIITKDVRTPEDIFKKALQIQGKYGLDVIIIDHVHLMECNGRESENQNAKMTKISNSLMRMTKELDVHIIALAQLSREVDSRQDKHPLLSDLRDSGSLEQDADNVIMLYRDSYYNKGNTDDVVEISIKKSRYGRLGDVQADFKKQFSKFKEPEFGGQYEKSSEIPM